MDTGLENWTRRATGIADAAGLLLAGEPIDIQRFILARIIAQWSRQFAAPTFFNAIDPDVETSDAAMCRLMDELRRAEAQIEREKWMRSAN